LELAATHVATRASHIMVATAPCSLSYLTHRTKNEISGAKPTTDPNADAALRCRPLVERGSPRVGAEHRAPSRDEDRKRRVERVCCCPGSRLREYVGAICPRTWRSARRKPSFDSEIPCGSFQIPFPEERNS